MAKKKVAKRSGPKKPPRAGKKVASKNKARAIAPVIASTEPTNITLGQNNFWFTVYGTNLSNPVHNPDSQSTTLVFTDNSTRGTYAIPNNKVSFGTSSAGAFKVLVEGISKQSIELLGAGRLKITVVAGRPVPPLTRKLVAYEADATVPG